VFFPERGDIAAVARARAICDNECTVWAECLDYAMAPHSPRDGVLAGLTARERQQLRRDTSLPIPVTTPRRKSKPLAAFPPITIDPFELLPLTRRQLLELRAADG
jgi:Transcription factor WhiB